LAPHAPKMFMRWVTAKLQVDQVLETLMFTPAFRDRPI